MIRTYGIIGVSVFQLIFCILQQLHTKWITVGWSFPFNATVKTRSELNRFHDSSTGIVSFTVEKKYSKS